MGSSDWLARLELSGSFATERSSLIVRGEIDLATVRWIDALLLAAAEDGTRQLTVDLAGVTFVGVVGLRALARAARRMADAGGRLVLRSPSPMVLKTMEVTGLGVALDIESAPARAQRARDVDGAMDVSLRLVKAALEGVADGVSVSVRVPSGVETGAATDDDIFAVDDAQHRSLQGPCVRAALSGELVNVPSVDELDRWPDFATNARHHGYCAVLSTPINGADSPIGALNLYSRSTGAFDERSSARAGRRAGELAALLEERCKSREDESSAARLADALETRTVIAQAQGVLMEREGRSPQEAYASLLANSVRAGRPLAELAADVVRAAESGREHSRGDG
jgi:anti-anti-sigma factor